jgi:hypothetical protein
MEPEQSRYTSRKDSSGTRRTLGEMTAGASFLWAILLGALLGAVLAGAV